jgi:uncharacterized membrane protein YdjX (TVP38/TMEM64 family)
MGFGGRGIMSGLSVDDGKRFRTVERWFKKGGFVFILVCAIIPMPFFDFVGIAAGAMNYPVWKFFLATLLGRIIRNIVIAWSGHRIIPG